MTRFPAAVLAAMTLLAVGSCSSASTPRQPGAGSPTAATATSTRPDAATAPTAPTAPTKSPVRTALVIPHKSAGEVARTVYLLDKGVPTQRRTMWEASTKGRFVVRAECSASAPGATVTYVVLDASPSARTAERRLTSGKFGCDDGKLTVEGVSPLVGKIQIRVGNMSPQVTSAYAVIVPE